MGRGIAHARARRTEEAERDFAAARVKAVDAMALNALCWDKDTAGMALSALAGCDAALGKSPDDARYRDSRAMVMLRLGRLDEAIADYDRALARSPRQASSLSGRALAWARKGDRVRSEADAAVAAKVDSDVSARFADHGLTLDPAPR